MRRASRADSTQLTVGTKPEHDAAGRRAAGRLDVVADLVDLPHDTAGARQQQPAGVGQHHAAAVAGEQFGAQLVFQEA